ncbi:saccharopine dehydrogenase NADP-binding domain-containing protein [Lysinibacillus sp. MHQ-1]|nr:saccharopine dehydrogenase NADP-binding domain-containing protein [Lysinibacillus sp. MHQ-1]
MYFLGDIDVKVAQDFVDTLNTDRVEVVELHAEQDDSLMKVISKGDVVINALFYSFNERVARAAIEAGVHSVDLGGHIGGVTENILDLHEQAKAKGVTIIPDLGVAPGMINILAGYGASKLDDVESIKLFVGGAFQLNQSLRSIIHVYFL